MTSETGGQSSIGLDSESLRAWSGTPCLALEVFQPAASLDGKGGFRVRADRRRIIPWTATERRRTQERSESKYDAILGHVYWPTQRGSRTSVSLRTHIMARALVLAYDRGRKADKIVVEGGHFWGPHYPAMAKLVVDMLVSTYHVPSDAIIQREKAYSTYGEAKTVLELAKENCWTRIMDLAFAAHHLTIPGIYKSKELRGAGPADLCIDCRSVESILERDDQRIVNVGKKFTTRYRLPYFIYEGLKWMLMHSPGFRYETLERTNKKLRTNPVNDVLFFRVDKFRLPDVDR
jgi:hypothetical protein